VEGEKRCMRVKTMGAVVVCLAAVAAGPAVGPAPAKQSPRAQVVKIVSRIQHADYEGDRGALRDLYVRLDAFVEDPGLASRVRYWRGFALWRRAINGFNESADLIEQDRDLTQAVNEFRAASERDPGWVEAKIGTLSCLGYLMFMYQKNETRLRDLAAQATPLMKETQAAAPDNPRLVWALGPMRWNTPAERGGGPDKVIDGYEKALEAAHREWNAGGDTLEPSWGEPELMMNLAWSYLNRPAPDLDASERYADSALKIVPYWHYVRDILVPQIDAARAKKG
jgi:hypothetical protein